MVDLGPVLDLLRVDKTSETGCPQAGTGWGQSNPSKFNTLPAVPVVPAPNTELQGSAQVPWPHDILERAAFLEFCEGLPRAEADARALAEAGFPCWKTLVAAQRADRGLTP